jgi:adenylate kinase family enzyme
MIDRIHILGASGSGTTTLARALSNKLDYVNYDTDDYFWEHTNPPYQQKKDIEERKTLLNSELKNHNKWILSGSLCGWGVVFIPYFDLVIYLWIPKEVRIDRLKERQRQRYGELIETDELIHKQNNVFVDWASQYDDGDLTIRSKKLHEKWLSELPCKVLRLEGLLEVEEKVAKVLEIIKEEKC